MRATRDTRQLNWLLAWAVVICDSGSPRGIFASLTALVEKPLILVSREVGNVNNKGGL
jgi:hypothetical protein